MQLRLTFDETDSHRSLDDHVRDLVRCLKQKGEKLPQLHEFKISKVEKGSIEIWLEPQTDLSLKTLNEALDTDRLGQFIDSLVSQLDGDGIKHLLCGQRDMGMKVYIQLNTEAPVKVLKMKGK